MNKQTNPNKALFNDIKFGSILGQENVKKQLAALIQGWRKGNYVPPILFTGLFGCGKTSIAKTFLAHFTGDNGKTKQMIFLNGSTLNTVPKSISLLQNFSGMNRTVLIDECHEIPLLVQNFLLTWFDTVSHFNPINSVKTSDGEYSVDFYLNQFVFATTEPHKINGPLKSRFKHIVLEPYSDTDLESIAKYSLRNLKKDGASEFDFTKDSIAKIIKYSRRNPRSICNIVNSLYNYSMVYESERLSCSFLDEIFKIENIFPLGLDYDEILILKHIAENPNGVTQSFLMNKLSGSARGKIRMIEQYLIQNELIYIDSLRKISSKGMEYLIKNKLIKKDVYHDATEENNGEGNDGGKGNGDFEMNGGGLSIVRVEKESRLIGNSLGI